MLKRTEARKGGRFSLFSAYSINLIYAGCTVLCPEQNERNANNNE